MNKDNRKNEKREKLIKTSVQARAIRDEMIKQASIAGNHTQAAYLEGKPLNFFIIRYIYSKGQNKTFKSFREWKNDGATVRKGEKAYLIWGQPRKANRKEENTEQNRPLTEEEKLAKQYEFFPLCYLFSEDQVYKKTEEAEEPKEEEQQPENAENKALNLNTVFA